MDVVKNVIIEMRPRLACCNVVIETNRGFVDKYHLKISIRPNYIVVNYTDYQSKKRSALKKRKNSHRDSSSSYESYSDSEEESYSYSKFINIASFCRLVPSSLSSLRTEENYISFRILIEPMGPNSSGTFYNEVISFPATIRPANGTINFCHFEKPLVNLEQLMKVKLQCRNCLFDLFSVVDRDLGEPFLSFVRILELPSDNLDMSEWFCHRHTPENSNDELRQKFSTLTPSTYEIFYGPCYFLVNLTNMRPSLVRFNRDKTNFHCKRCFHILGVKLNNTPCLKIWNSSVVFLNNENFSFRFFRNNFRINLPLEDFLQLIKYSVKNSNIDTVNTTCKIIFECKISETQCKTLLIWIIDKDLEVLKMKVHHCPTVNQAEILMDRVITYKLLYRIDDESEILKIWMKDPIVQTFEISKSMFMDGCRHLRDMSAHIPNSFRKSNDFYVSYMKI